MALTLAVAVRPAAAQDVHATSAARALFQEGLRFVDAGDWAAARDRFQRALVLRPSPLIRFNLATSCAHVGRLVQAMELFEQVRRDGRAPADARAASARELAVLRPRLGRLVVHVRGAPAGATVRVDGRVLPSALVGVAAPADPGPHTADAQRDGGSVTHGTADVPAGGTAELTLEVPPARRLPRIARTLDEGTALDASADGAGHGDARGDTWLWVGLSVGAAVVVAAMVVLAVVLLQPSDPSVWNGDTSPGTLRW